MFFNDAKKQRWSRIAPEGDPAHGGFASINSQNNLGELLGKEHSDNQSASLQVTTPFLSGSLGASWTQSRSDTDPFGDLDIGRDRRALFSAEPNNVFLIKVNYWLSR